MRFPITEKEVDKIKELMQMKPGCDFLIEVQQSNGIISKMDLVYVTNDPDLGGRSIEAHIPLDID
mgnify:FL=1|jgi:hypothetical protein